MKFRTVKNGYDPEEVESYVNRIREVYDETLVSQRDRIFSLKDELVKAENELAEYRARKSQISEAIESALSKAEEIERLTRKKIAKELASLRKFHKRWVEYFARLIKQYPLDETLQSAGEADKAISAILGEAEATPTEDFKSENFNPVEMIENHLASESVDEQFDYDAALHPEENLEQILKDLGVFFEDK